MWFVKMVNDHKGKNEQNWYRAQYHSDDARCYFFCVDLISGVNENIDPRTNHSYETQWYRIEKTLYRCKAKQGGDTSNDNGDNA